MRKEHLADVVNKLHIIEGPNGMCRCGKDGLTCGQQLSMLSQEIQDAQIIAEFPGEPFDPEIGAKGVQL